MLTKELQDLAWQCLPLEVKKEVKRLYRTRRNKRLNEVSSDFIYCLVYLFGKHNLTSDAEGEVMLVVPRSQVQDAFGLARATYNSIYPIGLPEYSSEMDIALGKMQVLDQFFGSKCLPDEPPLKITAAEDCIAMAKEEMGIKDEPKPAEPKFKPNDKVIFENVVCTIMQVCYEDYTYSLMKDKTGAFVAWIAESDLEPYTEPTDKNPKENANTFASYEPTTTKSDDFDNILKDGFSKERRLNIAKDFLSVLLGRLNYDPFTAQILCCNSDREPLNPYAHIARIAVTVADALLHEVEKGGSK